VARQVEHRGDHFAFGEIARSAKQNHGARLIAIRISRAFRIHGLRSPLSAIQAFSDEINNV
jgi:hypothetical protein